MILVPDVYDPPLTIDTKNVPVEGLHDVVRTYTSTVSPAAWFPFCMARYREKQKQKMPELLITSQNDLKFPLSVCANNLVTVIIWYCGMN